MGDLVALTCRNLHRAGCRGGLLIRGSRVRSPPGPLVRKISGETRGGWGADVVPHPHFRTSPSGGMPRASAVRNPVCPAPGAHSPHGPDPLPTAGPTPTLAHAHAARLARGSASSSQLCQCAGATGGGRPAWRCRVCDTVRTLGCSGAIAVPNEYAGRDGAPRV